MDLFAYPPKRLKLDMGQKAVLWFNGEQKFYFSSCPLLPISHVFQIVLRIIHCTIEIV